MKTAKGNLFSIGIVTILLVLLFVVPFGFVFGADSAVTPTKIPALKDLPTGAPQTATDVFLGFALGNAAGFFPALILVGLVTFFAGIAKYIMAGDNAEQQASGRSLIIYGLIVVFVMVAFWGFVNILTQSFFEKDAELPNFLPPVQN